MTILRAADFEPRARPPDPVFCVLPPPVRTFAKTSGGFCGAAPLGVASRSPRLHQSLASVKEIAADFPAGRGRFYNSRPRIPTGRKLHPSLGGEADKTS